MSADPRTWTPFDGHTEHALFAVGVERTRQEALCRQGKFRFTCAHPDVNDYEKLAVLAEEFGEVARELAERSIDVARFDEDKLYTELIQVAAVAVAWAEALQRNKKPR